MNNLSSRGFDRGWPDFDEPIPNERCDTVSLLHIRKTLSYLVEREGLKMEKFVVGAVDQFAMLRDAARHAGFKVTNITGNGKILCRDLLRPACLRQSAASRTSARTSSRTLRGSRSTLGMS